MQWKGVTFVFITVYKSQGHHRKDNISHEWLFGTFSFRATYTPSQLGFEFLRCSLKDTHKYNFRRDKV